MPEPPTKNPQPCMMDGRNFTSLTRTPWAGKKLSQHLKSSVARPGERIGESWEISLAKSHPSVDPTGISLRALVAEDPIGWLGDSEKQQATSMSELLIKILDTADRLSLQIHPRGDESFLKPDECGKPEAWYVVDRSKDAYLYFGFLPGVTEESVRAAIANNTVEELMKRVKPEPGDFFVIPPHLPHAIGPGVTLVEPQTVRAGLDGVTYRFWDWGRRYDKTGKQDPAGQPRALHLEKALRITNWNAPVENYCFHFPLTSLSAPLREQRLSPAWWKHFSCSRWLGDGSTTIQGTGGFRGITVLEGELQLVDNHHSVVVRRGQSVALPAKMGKKILRAHSLLAIDAQLPS